MTLTRRSILSAIGLALPTGLASRAQASSGPAPTLRFRPFEEAVRSAFADLARDPSSSAGSAPPCRRVEVGHSEEVRGGLQGCHNDRPFAGFPAGHLRVVRTGSGPGPERHGVRLYVSSVDILLTGGLAAGPFTRPLDFASLPPAILFA